MIDHLGFGVTDFARSKAFYLAALAPLGIATVMENEGGIGLGGRGKPFFWLAPGGPSPGSLHVAFTAVTRRDVDAFHRAAVAAGGKDNGTPGLRLHYHPNYYGAFVLDPDGNNIEAVCHTPEP